MKSTLLTLVAAVLAVHTSFAQIKQEARKEIDSDGSAANTMVIGEHGLLVFGGSEGSLGSDQWNITHFDKDLNQKPVTSFDYPEKGRFGGACASPGNELVYFIFSGRKEQLQLTSYDTRTSETKTVTGKLPPKFKVTSISVLGKTIFVTGKIKREGALMTLDAETGKATVIPLPGVGKGMVIDTVQHIEGRKAMAVSIIYERSDKERAYEIYFIDEHGVKAEESLKPNTGSDKHIVSSSITWLGTDRYILSGTYSADKQYKANGIYTAEFRGEQMQFIKYYNFSELKNFYEFIDSHDQKVKQINRAERKKRKGKEAVIKVNMIAHPVFSYDGGYVLIGEVYFPTFRTEQQTMYINGTAQTTTIVVFDGFQYSHAVVIGTDKDGNKLWDHCMKIYLEAKPYSVVRNLEVVSNKKEIKGFFSTGAKIESFTIEKDGIKTEEMGKIETAREGDEITWTGFTRSQYWYKNYFICYGKQSLKNTQDKNIDKNRTVFFVSKVSFDAGKTVK